MPPEETTEEKQKQMQTERIDAAFISYVYLAVRCLEIEKQPITCMDMVFHKARELMPAPWRDIFDEEACDTITQEIARIGDMFSSSQTEWQRYMVEE